MSNREPLVELDGGHVAEVQRRLLDWYARHGRDLPWRRTRDPYAILVAEVMSQQTQVDRVAPRWQAWLEQFPTLQHLARASRSEVIRAWQGLGYNLRAVRLHALAGQVVAEHGGELPRSVDGLRGLRGIGRYTAGAVACFAHDQPVSMVDTNVRRVLGRVFLGQVHLGLADRLRSQSVADGALPTAHAYAWNQALMDLGATVCRVERPMCLVCPLLQVCRAQSTGATLTGSARRAVSKQPAFKHSARYVRGRIIARLSALPSGTWVSLRELFADLRSVQADRLETVVSQLAADGLVVSDSLRGVRLP